MLFQKEHKRRVGLKHSDRTKIKMSISQKKRFESKKERERISKKTRDAMKSPKIRKKISEAHKGKVTWMKGRFHSKETKKKISLARKGKLIGNKNPTKRIEVREKLSNSHRGEKCNFWKGGISSENIKIRRSMEYILWRESVFARDNWTCQKYGIRGGILHSHHLKNFAQYSGLRFAIDNGITLSEKAHKEFHKKYGVKNNTKDQLLEFLKQDK
jgi:hypothetical protein